MKDIIEIGPAPANEDCAQVGDENYRQRALVECHWFIDVIRNALGVEPEGAELFVKSERHDFGTYYEVACSYDDHFPQSVEYAFRCESEAPTEWLTPQERAENGMADPLGTGDQPRKIGPM